MEIATGKDESSMMIEVDTAKWNDLANKLKVLPNGNAVVDATLDIWSLYEIYHRAHGWVEARIFKHDAKKKGGIEQKFDV